MACCFHLFVLHFHVCDVFDNMFLPQVSFMFATPLYKLLELNVITVLQCFNHIFCFNFVGFVVDAMFPY